MRLTICMRRLVGKYIAALGALHTALGAPAYVGSQACSTCHAAIYRAYQASPMARTSGDVAALGALPSGEFLHRESGATYEVKGRSMKYEKNGIEGERTLAFYFGAGVLGRSFLIYENGFLFQAPVSFYSTAGRWDMSPGYDRYQTIPLNRPVEPECLNCHAGRPQHRAGTPNGYRGRPFLEDGIGCERCHGPGGDHVARIGRTPGDGPKEIIHPARLSPRLRDSICAECHLPGSVRVFREPGFRPGSDLADSVVVFSGGRGPMEELWASRCKIVAGDRMWCGTCHDPHAATPRDQYRQKCLTCHQANQCKAPDAERAAKGDDCIACHMPKAPAGQVPHSSYTDHLIPRLSTGRPDASQGAPAAFWGRSPGRRDLGVALARLGVSRRDQTLFARAFSLLGAIESVIDEDAEALLYLATLYDERGNTDAAARLYRRAVSLNPAYVEASVNLGSILASRGQVEEAERLWQDALSRNPGLEAAAIKLASAQLLRGDQAAATATIRRARRYVPDLEWKTR
jgi:hypothetical protein